MLPLLGWLAAGVGSMWVYNNLTGSRQQVAPPRRYDHSVAEKDPATGLRVLRHDMRDSLHYALSQYVATPVMAGNGQPIPFHFVIAPKTDARQTDVYRAIGGAIRQGKWVAIRLDSVQQPEGGLLVSGPLAIIAELCKGDSPFCVIARPKPPESTAAKTAQAKPNEDEIAKMFAAYIASMSAEQRRQFGKDLIQGAESTPPQQDVLDPKDYARHSPQNGTHSVEPPINITSVESKTL